MNNKDCIFCKIISGIISSKIINESKHAIAFNDINPQAPIHYLIIPKIHIESTQDLNMHNINYFSEMIFLAKEIIKDNNIANGYRWIINTGELGGQTVGHLHMHLISGRKMNWPPG